MSGSLGFGANYLPALGLRLMAIDRPGLGLSDPQGLPFAFALVRGGLVEAIAIVSGAIFTNGND
jgi:alpha-beta hydrolase superfamily lysophospholipase